MTRTSLPGFDDVDDVSVAGGVDAVARRYRRGLALIMVPAADETQLLPVFHVPDVYAHQPPFNGELGTLGSTRGSRGYQVARLR